MKSDPVFMYTFRYGLVPLLPPQPEPRSYSSMPLPADRRWRQAGSLVSSHAAVCVWGSCALLVTEAREVEAKRQRLAAMSAKGMSKGALATWEDQVCPQVQGKSSRSPRQKIHNCMYALLNCCILQIASLNSSPSPSPSGPGSFSDLEKSIREIMQMLLSGGNLWKEGGIRTLILVVIEVRTVEGLMLGSCFRNLLWLRPLHPHPVHGSRVNVH